MLTPIENALVYAPVPKGRQSVLPLDGRIRAVGSVDRRAVETLGGDREVVDATDCLAVPGFSDPHEHLIGGSEAKGFASQTAPVEVSELVPRDITTVVGCPGVDTTMKTVRPSNSPTLVELVWSATGRHLPAVPEPRVPST